MARCYICNSPYHYSERCPRKDERKSQTKCYKCGEFGHKKDECTEVNFCRTTSKRSSNYSHYKYGESTSSVIQRDIPKNRVKVDLKLNGMWGTKSALLSEDCLLYKIKMEILNEIIDRDIVTDTDLRNFTPHINIEGDNNKYSLLNDSFYLIDIDSFDILNNFIRIRLLEDTHYTIIFSKKIRDSKEDLMMIISQVLGKYVINNNVETDKKCVICLDKDYNIVFLPCSHLCVCDICSEKIKICPMCRNEATDKMTVFLA